MTADATPSASNGLSSSSAPATNPTTIAVFCGASPGVSDTYLAAARDLANAMHAQEIRLVYGGGATGMMGELAKTLVSLSGPSAVHGIIPNALVKTERHGKIPDESEYGRTTVVEDMHMRKRMMAEEVLAAGPGSGFVALPGGYGTLDELIEIVTWNQLGIHDRGVCIFNVEGYWDGLIQWIHKAVSTGFISSGNKGILALASNADEVIRSLREYKVAEGRLSLDWSKS